MYCPDFAIYGYRTPEAKPQPKAEAKEVKHEG